MHKAVDVCSGCGAPLEAADAICPACNPPSDTSVPGTSCGKFLCPACNTRFGAVQLRAWPPEAPWYQFQRLAPKCPNCQAFLQDRRAMPFLSERQMLVFFVLYLVANSILTHVNMQWLLFTTLCVWLIWRGWREWRVNSVTPEEHRYISMPPI